MMYGFALDAAVQENFFRFAITATVPLFQPRSFKSATGF
jgi:hypothetical protein